MLSDALAFAVVALAIASAQQVSASKDASPAQGEAHHQGVDSRGDHAMGFSHETTTHHFRLYKDGGAVEVVANDPKDTVGRDQIRMHLGHIARLFAAGDFNIPGFIHATEPPGTAVMAKLREQIHYSYIETSRGATLRIATLNPEAVAAIHSFLRFQIRDHQTADSTSVSTP
jgi:hypothetical protein